MEILYILLPLSLLLAAIGFAGYFWSVRSGQLDDLDTPALRVLLDQEELDPNKKQQ
jgi:cbb3-type cytochrome oxidase maturation protein